MQDSNKVLYPGYGGVNDIKMSLIDYYELLSDLRQDDLSAKGVLRFKNLFACNVYTGTAMLFQSIVPAYLITRFLTGPVYRAHADYKISVPLCFTFYVIQMWRNVYKPIPRRIYTEIFTDEGTDGKYIRSVLREKKPNLWTDISRQLNTVGYKFEEMNEVNDKEFPTALLK